MKKTEMKVVYAWRSLGIINTLKALWPSKTKKYILKWAKAQPLVHEVTFYTNRFTGMLAVCFDLSQKISDMTNPMHMHFADALGNITDLENMRSVDELCIWLDMRDAV
jgi:hypothetical protein